MRLWLLVLAALLCGPALAQSGAVRPGELALSVTVENTGHTPYEREMVMIRIRGAYRRHITLEKLEQPDLDGFSWAQLGPDHWSEERINGRPVKVFERRMALYPTRSGRLTIGPFIHHLTLTDEGDDWFDHDVKSEPITVDVDPAPADTQWWFPVFSLEISDNWSNPATQLQEGEGVLRVIRLEALGAMPDMIPPMPQMHSPSALIFPHPEKRLVEQTPYGPVTYAFWRWTIRPTNGTSAIIEPIEVPFYDTRNRVARVAEISAQRIAYAERDIAEASDTEQSALPGLAAALAALLAFCGGLGLALRGRDFALGPWLTRWSWLDPQAWRMRHAAAKGDAPEMRRAALRIMERDVSQVSPHRQAAFAAIDKYIFGIGGEAVDLMELAKKFQQTSVK